MPLTKISALRDPIDIEMISRMRPSYISFDFMPLSPRYFGEADAALLWDLPLRIRRVGRFAEQDPLRIVSVAARYGLSSVQLDGLETPADCELLSSEGLEVIKSITDDNFAYADRFEGLCNRFVFRLSDPSIIDNYSGHTPFLIETTQGAYHHPHPRFSGVDCGQEGFERACACKNISQVESYLKSYQL